MINFKHYLIERVDIEKTLKQMGSKLEARIKSDRTATDARKVIETALDSDPTPNKQYALWILRTYLNKGINLFEDFSRTGNALEIFHKHKTKMPKKDINQIKSLSELENMVEAFSDTLSGKEEKAVLSDKIKKETTFVYQSGKDVILIPKTEAASCFWGKGTKWCTAATKGKNEFQRYDDQGTLYIIIKGGKKYQFHMETDSYMNDKDQGLKTNAEMNTVNWFFDKMGEKFQINTVAQNAYGILRIKNPSEKVQLAAIQRNGGVIKYIKNPSEKVQIAAVAQNAYGILRIKNPSEKVQLAAIQRNGDVIKYIENPTQKVMDLANGK
ncbi:MAG: hypothetical protein COA52_00755 [Hyphomicrobiales bacterium]|nr:MAG: hypothetical protein COA52_00755 [Hyphomicrobiales bacterium]